VAITKQKNPISFHCFIAKVDSVIVDRSRCINFSVYTPKINSRCFGIGHGNFAFNLVVKLSVELGYVFLSLRL
jgi:hypothetical protein